MLIGLIVVGFFLLSKSPFSWHLRNLLFPSQRLRKQTFGDPYCTHYFLCWEEIDPSTSVYGTGWGMMPVWSCFPRPVLPDQQEALGDGLRSWPRLLRGATFSLQHFALLNYCWSFLHLFSFSLSLGRSLTHTLHFVFYPDMLRRSRQQRKARSLHANEYFFHRANQIIKWRAILWKS